jgi:signal transduction histidine kinase
VASRRPGDERRVNIANPQLRGTLHEPYTSPVVDGAAITGAAIVGAVVGATIVALAAGARARRVREELDRSTSALIEQERTAAESVAIRQVVDAAMRDGVLLFDGTGQLAYTNDASERQLGRRPASIAQLFPAAAAEMAAVAAASGEPGVVEAETASPARWLRFTATPAGDGGVLVVVSDVTEARQLDAIRRDFVVNASHELKTPAASIQAAAETLMGALRDDPDSVPRFAATLEREAARLSRIVADLLDLSRLESGGDPDAAVRFDALVEEEVRRFEERARTAQLTLEVRTDGGTRLRGSERDLALMVGNLIDNAIRYTPAGGSVDVSVSGSNDHILLRVKDSGIGIPQRDLTRVLERFYRVDSGRSRRTGGTGLGLSIVRHVAENHGGSVSLQSEIGHGTTVDVVLPGGETN